MGALWGIETLAEKAEVSYTTIIRVARIFGFNGFADFRRALKESCHQRGEASSAIQIFQAPADSGGVLLEVAKRDGLNTQAMLKVVDQPLLENLVSRFTSAQQRLLLGRGPAQVMCEMLAIQLAQAGLSCLTGSPADFSTQVVNLTPRDLLVAISLAPYSQDTISAMAAAHDAGIPSVGFTDRADSPLARFCDVLVLIPSENLLYTHSFTTFSIVSHAIATILATRDPQGTLRRIKAWDRFSRNGFMDDRAVSPKKTE
jgi:DNA-binding MurR/RpiR family transcriptional regulator